MEKNIADDVQYNNYSLGIKGVNQQLIEVDKILKSKVIELGRKYEEALTNPNLGEELVSLEVEISKLLKAKERLEKEKKVAAFDSLDGLFINPELEKDRIISTTLDYKYNGNGTYSRVKVENWLSGKRDEYILEENLRIEEYEQYKYISEESKADGNVTSTFRQK